MDFTPTFKEVSVEHAHRLILSDAAEYANQYAVLDEQLPEIVGGGPFSAAPERSLRGGLALAIEPGMAYLPAKKLARLREHGREGVRQALLENQTLFVGVIMGHAKAGVNYFDRFGLPGDQGRLF